MNLTIERFAVACAFLFIALQVSEGFKNKEEERAEQQRPDVACLADNIYHEARGESEQGRLAVAFVTWARANETVEQLCDTVWRPHQFSWTGNKVYVTDDAAYKEAVRLAWAVVKGKVANPVPGATHFHATHVKPYWVKHSQKIQRIGNHVFYKPKERKNGSSKA